MNSKKYWHDREKRNIEQRKKNDQRTAKQLTKKYQMTLDTINKEINANYTNFAGREGISLLEAKKRTDKMDVQAFSRKAKRYSETKDFSAKANEELRLYNATMRINRLELLKAEIGLEITALSDDADKFLDQSLRQSEIEERKRQAGILGNTGDISTTAGIVGDNYYRNADFSRRIWGNLERLKREIDLLLTKTIVQGKGARFVARELRQKFNVHKYEAERLMRTETAKLQTEVQRYYYEKNKVEEFEWIIEDTACKKCQEFEGVKFKVSELTAGENAPPAHPNCRCSTIPVIGGDE